MLLEALSAKWRNLFPRSCHQILLHISLTQTDYNLFCNPWLADNLHPGPLLGSGSWEAWPAGEEWRPDQRWASAKKRTQVFHMCQLGLLPGRTVGPLKRLALNPKYVNFTLVLRVYEGKQVICFSSWKSLPSAACETQPFWADVIPGSRSSVRQNRLPLDSIRKSCGDGAVVPPRGEQKWLLISANRKYT